MNSGTGGCCWSKKGIKLSNEGGRGGGWERGVVSSSTRYSTAVASELTTTYASFISGRLATPCRVLRPSLSAEPELSTQDFQKKKREKKGGIFSVSLPANLFPPSWSEGKALVG